jgi:hypothetical protein
MMTGVAGSYRMDAVRIPRCTINDDWRRQMTKPFVPGFETEAQARKAGRNFFATVGGRKGVEGVDFHLVPNEHGRWHFQEGKAPTPAAAEAPTAPRAG